jgi:hypothetical protein
LGAWALVNLALLAGWRQRRFRRLLGGAVYLTDAAIAVWIGLVLPTTLDVISVGAMLGGVVVACATFFALTVRQV